MTSQVLLTSSFRLSPPPSPTPYTLYAVPCTIVLMPPADPNSPNSQYDFIMKGDQPAAQTKAQSITGKFFLPKKMIFIAIGGVFAVIIGLVVFSSLSKDTGPANNLTALVGTSAEIARVSDLVTAQSKDADALSLAATTSAALTSQSGQLSSYASSAGVIIDPKLLVLYTDKKIDADLESAAVNNQLETTYYSYLNNKLPSYQSKLQALSTTKSTTLLTVLEDSYNSAQIILTAPQLKP